MFNKILCPIDFTKESYVALAKSIEVAYYDSRSEVLMLHVSEPSTGSTLSANSIPQKQPGALTTLQALFINRVPSHIQLTAVTVHGPLNEQLEQIATEEQIDLLVLPAYLNGVETTESLQQVVSKILNTTLCSILSVGKTTEYTIAEATHRETASDYTLPRPAFIHDKACFTTLCTSPG